MNQITDELLRLISGIKSGEMKGAYNIREDGQCAARQSSENILIESKTDAPGLVIHIRPGTRGETVYIPACVTHAGVDDLVYNDFYVGEGADVIIEAGCGVHSEGEEEARHNGIHRFLLAKTPILLHDLIEDQDAPFIYEKMGTYVHHIMIDEFQDTSAMQWKNFKVLLQEGMASGHGNLIVGDVKQSIYRWRNGDWSILNHIDKEMAAYRPDIRNLDTNHRSERRLIAFNNAFFPAAAAALDDIAPEASTKLAEIYADVAQQCPPQKADNGHVCIRFYDEKDKTNEVQMLDELCQQVERLHREGLPYGKMAILLRKRKFADPIIRHFATRLPDVKIVSDEAFLLSSSLAINILIAAMRYMANPEDKVSLAFLALHAGLGEPPQTDARSLAGQPSEHLVAECL